MLLKQGEGWLCGIFYLHNIRVVLYPRVLGLTEF